MGFSCWTTSLFTLVQVSSFGEILLRRVPPATLWAVLAVLHAGVSRSLSRAASAPKIGLGAFGLEGHNHPMSSTPVKPGSLGNRKCCGIRAWLTRPPQSVRNTYDFGRKGISTGKHTE